MLLEKPLHQKIREQNKKCNGMTVIYNYIKLCQSLYWKDQVDSYSLITFDFNGSVSFYVSLCWQHNCNKFALTSFILELKWTPKNTLTKFNKHLTKLTKFHKINKNSQNYINCQNLHMESHSDNFVILN
jgi:hypothetical protein